MFWATVSEGSRLKAWKTNPIRSRRRIVSRRSLSPASSVSPSVTVPDVGRSSPAATCRKVLLPDPDGPMIAVNDPRANPTLTPSRATTAPSPWPWTLRTSRRATAGAGMPSAGRATTLAFLLANMGATSMAGRRGGGTPGTLPVAPRPSHPAYLRPSVRALVPDRAASRTVHDGLESPPAHAPLVALGRLSTRARGQSGRSPAGARARTFHGARPERMVLARALGRGRDRELRRAHPGALRPRPADLGLRRDPHALPP